MMGITDISSDPQPQPHAVDIQSLPHAVDPQFQFLAVVERDDPCNPIWMEDEDIGDGPVIILEDNECQFFKV